MNLVKSSLQKCFRQVILTPSAVKYPTIDGATNPEREDMPFESPYKVPEIYRFEYND